MFNSNVFEKFCMSENETEYANNIVAFGNQATTQKAEAMNALSSF